MTYFENQIVEALFKGNPFYPHKFAHLPEKEVKACVLLEIKRIREEIKDRRKRMLRALIENEELRQGDLFVTGG